MSVHKYVPVVAVLLVAVAASAELPIPKDPLWTPVRDDVYLQEAGECIKTDSPLSAVAVLDGVAYVGTAGGVQLLKGSELLSAGGPSAPITRLKTIGDGLWAFTAQGAWRFSKGEWKQVTTEPCVDACEHLGATILVTAQQVYRLDGENLKKLNAVTPMSPILGVASYAETIYVRHKDTIVFLKDGKFECDFVKDWGHLPSGCIVRDMMTFGSSLLVPTDRGLAALRGMSFVNTTGKDGLCYEDTTCVARGFEKNDYWVGTTRGAVRCINGEFQYFGYQRWIPNDRVNAIACGERAVYIATDGGLGIIRYEPYTLQKKADWYERWIDEWGMRRAGFICTLEWNEETKQWVRFISDNDGGWLCHLMNAYCFKYAVTKDPKVREQAVDAFRTLRWCEQITGIPGFPARAIATVGEPSSLAPTGSAGLPSEWNPTADGKWLWKGDTSSDEIDSHLQSTMIFYELASQGKEREAAQEHLRRIIGHIVDHHFTLCDLDGKPTRWARWDPEYLNDPKNYDSRGLNSLESLAQMTAAYAITGDEKFKNAKQQLLDWGYLDRVLRTKVVFPVVTHFDDRLAFLNYYPILTYEQDPDRRAIIRRALERSWEVKRMENMVWFNLVYGALTGNDIDAARCLKNLQAWPLDCHNWTFHNSHRSDLATPAGYVNYITDTKSMTNRDIGVVRWDSDFMRLDGGGDGKAIEDPSAFLDAYWMARYYGMILAPDTKDNDALTVPESHRQLGAKPYAGPPRPDVGF